MFRFFLFGFGILFGVFGLLFNLYIFLVLICNKKTKSNNEWILVHLSFSGLLTALTVLLFTAPSILIEEAPWVCQIVGAALLHFTFISVWSVTALSADRCFAIVSPLRYTQIVTRKRMSLFFLSAWASSVVCVSGAYLVPMVSQQPDFNLTSLNFTLEENGNETGSVGCSNFRPLLGACFPLLCEVTIGSLSWVGSWILLVLIGPVTTVLVCDLIVLTIARKQRNRIIMALYQITLSAQATVTRLSYSKDNEPPNFPQPMRKGAAPPLWLNQSVPPRSKAWSAVWEDLAALLILHLPLILIFVFEILWEGEAPEILLLIGSVSLFLGPTFNAVLYGIRARPLRTAYKSYLRKRMTNNTLEHEIQQRLSPVDGSPRPSSRTKIFRSASPSPNSSPIPTPARRQSVNDLRPPNYFLTSSPSSDRLGRSGSERGGVGKRKVRSFLHIPTQYDVSEFWTGLVRPNRSPTIVITHELIRVKDSSEPSSPNTPLEAEQRL